MENNKYTELEKIILGELKLLEQSLKDFNGSYKTVELDQQLIGRLSRMDSIRDQQMTKASMIRRGQRKSELIKACVGKRRSPHRHTKTNLQILE